jgi:hypothetical protein
MTVKVMVKRKVFFVPLVYIIKDMVLFSSFFYRFLLINELGMSGSQL